MSYTRIPLDPTPSSVRRARAVTQRWLIDVGLSLAEYRAAVVVSELVTNAIEHARGPIALHLWSQRHGVKVGVSDGSTTVGSLRRPDDDDACGRGLQVVEQLSDEWGTDVDSSGKLVWAEIPAAT